MADESQELVFEDEAAREAAVDALGESPDDEGQLDAIMSAPIKARDEADDNNPADPPPDDSKSNDTNDNSQTPSETEVEKPSETPPAEEEVFQIKRSELPEEFDGPSKLLKSYSSAQDLLKRQEKFIKEKLGGEDQNLTTAMKRAETAEAELAKIRKQVEKPAQEETVKEDLSKIPPSNSIKIKEVRQELQELVKDPIANETEISDRRLQLDDLWIAEHERTALLIERTEQRAAAAEQRAQKAESTATGFVSKVEQTESQKRHKEALQNEYKDIDTFSNNDDYPEFKMKKSSEEVEGEYMKWGSEVAKLYHGVQVDVTTNEGRNLMYLALDNLNKGAPDITEKCQLAGITIKPNEDVQKYIDVCDLLDYRDGYRTDPVTGKRDIVKRYHAPSGKFIPDAFPTLKAAYEHRKVTDGYYSKKIRDAYLDGGKGMAEAASRADNSAVEMGNSAGVSKTDAGLKMTPQQADEILDRVNEEEAKIKKAAGDSFDYDKLMEAFQVLGIPAD